MVCFFRGKACWLLVAGHWEVRSECVNFMGSWRLKAVMARVAYVIGRRGPHRTVGGTVDFSLCASPLFEAGN